MKNFIYYIVAAILLLVSCEQNPFENENHQDVEISYNTFFNSANELKLHEVEVHISQSEWNRLISILEDNIASDKYVKADFIYRHTPEDTELVDTVQEIGFRIRGNTTRRLPYKNGEFRRAHFKIKFDKNFSFEKGTAEYEERKKRTFADIEAINLKWGREGDQSDPSQIREIYQYDMMQKAGVFVPKTTSCHLILRVGSQSIDYGLYTMIEPIDDTFLEHNFGHEDGDLYKCLWKKMGPATLSRTSAEGSKVGEGDAETGYEPTYDLKDGDLNSGRLQQFIQDIRNYSGDDFKTYIDQNFDIDRFLRFTAMNVILGMPDDYWGMGNNYYLFFPEHSDKITFIPYDYDHGLGGGWHPFNTAEANIYKWWDGTGNSYRPLMKVLQIDEYKAKYESYLEAFELGENAIFDYSDYNDNYFTVLEGMYEPFLDNDLDEGEQFEHYGEQQYFSRKKASLTSQLK